MPTSPRARNNDENVVIRAAARPMSPPPPARLPRRRAWRGPAAALLWLALSAAPAHAAPEGPALMRVVPDRALDDPRAALTWIVNELSSLGIALEPGEIVTTGTCMTPLEIEPGDHVVADFGSLGVVEVRFG